MTPRHQADLFGLGLCAVIGLTWAAFTGQWQVLGGMLLGSCIEIIFRPFARLEAWLRRRMG